MSVQAWFSNDEVELDAGSSVTLTLSIQNVGESTASYTIVPSGLTANWVTVDRGNLTLFAGSSDVVEVEVMPPRLPTTSAGPSVIGVRVIPTEDPDSQANAETTLDILPFDDRRIVALHPVARARRRTNFEFMVENHGNGLASCRLRLVDPSGRIDGTFDPPAVGVAPGGSSLVRFRAKANGLFRRHLRTLDLRGCSRLTADGLAQALGGTADALAAPELVEAGIGRDPVGPGGEGGPAVEAGETPDDGEQGLLGRVFGQEVVELAPRQEAQRRRTAQ